MQPSACIESDSPSRLNITGPVSHCNEHWILSCKADFGFWGEGPQREAGPEFCCDELKAVFLPLKWLS